MGEQDEHAVVDVRAQGRAAAASRGARGEREGRQDRERDETSGAPHANAFQFEMIRETARNAINSTQSVRTTRRTLHRWIRIGGCRWRQLSELRQQVHPVLLHQRSELGRARHAPRGGERLADLVGREVLQRVLVDARRVGPQGEHHHHVRQVDGLTPWGRSDLHEEHIDEAELVVLHHEVRRLDVAVGQADVPHAPDQARPSSIT